LIDKYKNHILFISFLKLAIIFLLPLTGDEAYFIKWANNLDIGYYDHPPMVGWLIYLMQYINDSFVAFRLFSFASVFIISFLIYKILIELDIQKEKAIFSAIMFIIFPVDILVLLFTNDIPLVLFGTIGSYFLLLSFRKNYVLNSFVAGIFLGLSFLSKYFAVFLFLGLVIYIIIRYRTKAIKHILIVAITVLPFIAENLYFNYNSCQNNIMFNFFARTGDLHYNISTTIGYFKTLFYLLTPWGIYYIYKSRANIDKKVFLFILSVAGVGLAIFLLVSFKKKIGLHWLLLLLPYIFMLFAFVEDKYKNNLAKYSLIFTYFHIVILLGILMIPDSMMQKHKRYKDIMLFTKTKSICNNISKYDDLYTTDYTSASVLSYHCKQDIKMIMNNSKYGRFDDKLVDIRDLQTRHINIFYEKKPDKNSLESLFDEVSISSFEIDQYSFYVAHLSNLNYKEYKKQYLDIQKEKFYNIPKWLPTGKCYFYDRYYNNHKEDKL
jgi:hypothetical protein